MNEREVFIEALKREDAQERTAWVETACAGDERLRQSVQQLLIQHLRQEMFFLDGPVPLFSAVSLVASDPGLTAGPEPDCSVSMQTQANVRDVGPYRIREQIGEGGFGVVYVAEQSAPIRRMVALKVIKPGMDSKEIIARFEAERQAVAMMDHPNVARVLDAGTTDTGHPYFVMELVRGVAITDFCNRERLTTEERLNLFRDVCRAVQHAHQKGIIHRDIKPSNVLVTLHDGRPVVKVIDFGVAKALSQQLTEKSVYTAMGQIIGTPLYMSPEQAEMSGLDVDTRSDVYSLGVLLYELLSGLIPFDRETLKAAGWDEMRRMIRETEPVRPSVRLSTISNEQRSTISDQRRLDIKRLQLALRGDLDSIVMKALEKDRNRRYASPAEFAADIERSLAGQPILAGVPSTVYRAKKFVRRHQRKLAASAIALLGLLAGLTVAVIQWKEAVTARDLAERRLNELGKQKEFSEGLLYASDIELAARALNEGDAAQASTLLSRHRPANGMQDRRGIEWQYLDRQARGSLSGSHISESPLYTVCMTPDRQRIVTAGAEAIIHILMADSLSLERTIHSGQLEVNGLSLTSDGKILISSGDDGTIRLWNFESGELIRSIRFGEEKVWQAVVDADGKFLMACGNANDVRVFSVDTGERIRSLECHQRAVEAIAVSPDGRLLACASSDGRSSVWDWKQGVRVYLSDPLKRRLISVVFTPDGRRMADASIAGDVRITNTDTWKTDQRFRLPDAIQCVAAAPDGNSVAAVTRSGTVHQLSSDGDDVSGKTTAEKSQQADVRLVHQGRGNGICWADDQVMVSVGNDGYVRRTRFTRQRNTGIKIPNVAARTLSVAPKGRWIAWAAADQIGLYDRISSTHVPLTAFPSVPYCSAVCFTPDGHTMVFATTDGRLMTASVDHPDQTDVRPLPVKLDVASLKFSRDGQRLLVTDRTANRAMVLDYSSMKIICRIEHRQLNFADISPDGRHVAVTRGADLLVLDVESGKQIAESVRHHHETISKVLFTELAHQIISIGDDRAVRIWDWERKKESQLIGMHNRGTPKALTLSRDQRTLFTCDRGGDILVWSLPSMQRLFTLTTIQNPCADLALAADDSIIAVAVEEGQSFWIPLYTSAQGVHVW